MHGSWVPSPDGCLPRGAPYPGRGLTTRAPWAAGYLPRGAAYPGRGLTTRAPWAAGDLVKDARTVSEATEDIHLVVPNSYTLLVIPPSTRTWYSVLDLKDAFFCIPLVPESQEILAFEWQDSTYNKKNATGMSCPKSSKIPPPSLGKL